MTEVCEYVCVCFVIARILSRCDFFKRASNLPVPFFRLHSVMRKSNFVLLTAAEKEDALQSGQNMLFVYWSLSL